MLTTFKRNTIAFAGFLVIVLSGCGDGSTAPAETVALTPLTPASTSTPTPAPTPTPTPAPDNAATTDIVISGIVATGAPCADMPVIFPNSGIAAPNVRSASDGSYTATLSVPAKDVAKPLVIQAECENTAGGSDTLVSVVPRRASGTVNVNPLTNLIGALLSKSGDPKLLGFELSNGTITMDAAAIAAKVDQVREILLPAISALTLASSFDPIKGIATANGAGVDRLLDMLKIEITPEANNTSSIAITLKIKNTNETDSQPVIRFTNVTPLDIIKFNNQITAVSVQQVVFIANLVIPGETAGLIADLMSRMNACYALPGAARSSNPTALSQTCALAFVDGKVANFLENGLRGMDALIIPRLGLAFSDSAVMTLLSDAPGTKFTLATYQYLRPNGVMGLTAKKTSPDNTITTVSLEAQVGNDGKLGLSGNQYRFQAKIVPLAERHTFLNQTSSNYLSTGVSIAVPLQFNNNVPVSKVVVTPPANRILGNPASFTLLPGADGMVFPLKNALLNDTSSPSSSSFLRLRSEYSDVITGDSRRHPSSRDFGEYFANDISESALQQFSTGDVWTVAFYVSGASEPESQYYRLPARPYTITELRSLTVPELEAQTRKYLQSLLVSDGGDTIGVTPLSGLPALTLPSTGKPEPIEQRVYGDTAPAGANADIFFTDFSYLLFGRLGSQIVPCRNGASGDLHCAADGTYASGAFLSGVELLARLPDRRELAHHFSVLQLLP